MECFVVPSTLITRSCVTCVTLNHNTHCKNHSSCTHKTCTLWIYMHDLNTIQSVRTQLTTTTLALTQRVWHMIHTQRDQIWTGTAILSVSAGQGQKMSDGSGDSHSQSWQWESITFGCNVDLRRTMSLKKVWSQVLLWFCTLQWNLPVTTMHAPFLKDDTVTVAHPVHHCVIISKKSQSIKTKKQKQKIIWTKW